MSIIPSSLEDIHHQLSAMREVSVVMEYGVHDAPEIISPNFVAFTPQTDTIDKSGLETIRQLWLRALSDKAEVETMPRNLSWAQRVEKILESALTPKNNGLTMDEAFVRAAAYPVPSEYTVKLPPVERSMRVDIIEALIPFQKTRAMLLRLEEVLESPMRSLKIGHAPVSSLVELQASIQATSGKRFALN